MKTEVAKLNFDNIDIYTLLVMTLIYFVYLFLNPRYNRLKDLTAKHVSIAYVFEIVFSFVAITVSAGLLASMTQLLINFDTLQQIIYSLALFMIFYLNVPKIVSLMSRVNRFAEIRRFNKQKTSSAKNIFQWLEEDDIDKVFYDIFKQVNVLDNEQLNLKKAKSAIISKFGDEIGDYYLLRNYIDSNINNSIFNKTTTMIGTIITSFLAGILSKSLVSEKNMEKIIEVLKDSVSFETADLIIFLIKAFTVIICVVALLIYTVNEFTRSKRRMNQVLGIINAIIEEKNSSTS
jgi:hypothetical protein